MADPLKVDVAYTADKRWIAEIEPDFDQPFEWGRLLELIDAIRKAWPDDDLIFIIDADSIQGHSAAESEYDDATNASGAAIRKSREIS